LLLVIPSFIYLFIYLFYFIFFFFFSIKSGLNVWKLIKCSECGMLTKPKSLTFQEKHAREHDNKCQWIPAAAQQSHHRAPFTAVDVPADIMPGLDAQPDNDDISAVMRQGRRPIEEHFSTSSSEERDVTGFFQRCGWLDTVSDILTIPLIQKLVALPSPDIDINQIDSEDDDDSDTDATTTDNTASPAASRSLRYPVRDLEHSENNDEDPDTTASAIKEAALTFFKDGTKYLQENLFTRFIDRVDIVAFDPNVRGNTFDPLQADTQVKYANTLARLLLFLFRIIQRRGSLPMSIPANIISCVANMTKSPGIVNVRDLLLELAGTVESNRSDHVVGWFVRCMSVRQDGIFRSPNLVHQLCAQVMYAMRLAVFFRNDPTKHSLLRHPKTSTFSFLADMSQFSGRFAADEIRAPILSWVPGKNFSQMRIVRSGRLVSLDDFRSARRQVMVDLHAQLSKLTFNCRLPVFSSIKKSQTRNDGSLLIPDDSATTYVAMAHAPQNRHVIVDNCFVENAAKAYLKSCGDFVDNLLFALQLTCGMPARAAELGTIQIAPTPVRGSSIFFLNGL
jgi:hypothetical protein